MSLSKPNNPLFITEGMASDKQQVSSLDTNQNATLINQLHGINTSNAIGAGIPKQVSNVQVSIANAQTGSTCTVTVLYRVDPTDKNFAGVAIFVKGYQGNNQLVQVSSGTSSPTKFVLNNTGEIVSFTIQAYGNGGSAPLPGSPTCSGTLPKSVGGGFGSNTSTSIPGSTRFQTNGVDNTVQTLLNLRSTDGTVKLTADSSGDVDFSTRVNCNHFWGGVGTINCAPVGTGGRISPNASSNTVACIKFYLDASQSIGRVIINCLQTNTGTGKAAFGIYDAGGNLITQACYTGLGGAVGPMEQAVTTPVQLSPGNYWFCYSSDAFADALPFLVATVALDRQENELLNASSVGDPIVATAANAMSGGVLPATLGALTALNLSSLRSIPRVVFLA
jgi:hypothetical protein